MPEISETTLPGMVQEKPNPNRLLHLNEAEPFHFDVLSDADLTSRKESNQRGACFSQRKQGLFKYVEENVVGNRIEFIGPFGRRRGL